MGTGFVEVTTPGRVPEGSGGAFVTVGAPHASSGALLAWLNTATGFVKPAAVRPDGGGGTLRVAAADTDGFAVDEPPRRMALMSGAPTGT